MKLKLLFPALVCAAAFVYGVHLHLVVHEDWGAGFRAQLTPKERRMALFSEGAFYFSFGQQFIDADTPADGIRGLLADRRTDRRQTAHVRRIDRRPTAGRPQDACMNSGQPPTDRRTDHRPTAGGRPPNIIGHWPSKMIACPH